MNFFGRGKELPGIIKALEQSRNIVVTGKYGIGKTTLVKEAAKITGERWNDKKSLFSKRIKGATVSRPLSLKQLLEIRTCRWGFNPKKSPKV